MLHAAAHAQQPLDPDQVAALLLPSREPPRRGRWLLFAVAVHAAAALALARASSAPEAAPERIVRVQLLPAAGEVAPGPPAPAAPAAPPKAARAAPPRPRAAVAPRPAQAKPAPRPAAVAATAERVEPAPAPGAADGGARDGSAIAAVASAPPGGAGARNGAGPGGGDEIAVYLSQVRALLGRHQRYPAMAQRRGLEGTVLLQLRIGADGRIESARAESGAPRLFARSALDAVGRAGRLPAPPRGPLAIEVPLRFQLDD